MWDGQLTDSYGQLAASGRVRRANARPCPDVRLDTVCLSRAPQLSEPSVNCPYKKVRDLRGF